MKISLLATTNRLLQQVKIGTSKPILCLLTGSSGCGKTHLCEALEAELNASRAEVRYFDKIGVPSEDEMMSRWGSGEKWQEAMTHEWIERLISMTDKALVVFEGQYHPRFALEACKRHEISEYLICVVTCDQSVWEARLRGPREQPDLITEDMKNWARVLREETLRLGGSVIDTSESNLTKNINDVVGLINPLIEARING